MFSLSSEYSPVLRFLKSELRALEDTRGWMVRSLEDSPPLDLSNSATKGGMGLGSLIDDAKVLGLMLVDFGTIIESKVPRPRTDIGHATGVVFCFNLVGKIGMKPFVS